MAQHALSRQFKAAASFIIFVFFFFHRMSCPKSIPPVSSPFLGSLLWSAFFILFILTFVFLSPFPSNFQIRQVISLHSVPPCRVVFSFPPPVQIRDQQYWLWCFLRMISGIWTIGKRCGRFESPSRAITFFSLPFRVFFSLK